MPQLPHNPPEGAQRLSLDRLRRFEALGYGMFIHFGMSTFDLAELSLGDKPSTHYAPDKLDVDQWISVARDAGMRYAVLTTKHVAGHCLWPSKHTDYHVGTSGNKTDVVEEFVKACERRGVKPGFYYCSYDNRHLLGSKTPSFVNWDRAYTTSEYREFQHQQIEELLTQYGPVEVVWVDCPYMLGPDGRRKQYDQIVRLQPDAIVTMNPLMGDGITLHYDKVWPTDVMAIERHLPSSHDGYNPWFKIVEGSRHVDAGPVSSVRDEDPPLSYFLPGEVCDPIGYDWFYNPRDHLRSDIELLGMRLITRARKANLLLDVPPDPHGLLPKATVDALLRLEKNYQKVL